LEVTDLSVDVMDYCEGNQEDESHTMHLVCDSPH
jgi:hypothetical protein